MRVFIIACAIMILSFFSKVISSDELLWNERTFSKNFSEILLSPDGKYFYSKNHRYFFNIARNEFTFDIPYDSLTSTKVNMEFGTVDNQIIFSKSDDSHIYYYIYDIESSTIVDTKIFNIESVTSFSTTKNLKYIYAFTDDFYFHYWNFETGEKIGEYFNDTLYAGSGWLSDDGEILFGTQYQRFFAYDLNEKKPLFFGSSHYIESSRGRKFYCDGKNCFLNGEQSHLIGFNIETEQIIDTALGGVRKVEFSKIGNYAYAITSDKIYKIQLDDYSFELIYESEYNYCDIACGNDFETCIISNSGLTIINLLTGETENRNYFFSPAWIHFGIDNRTLTAKSTLGLQHFDYHNGTFLGFNEYWGSYCNIVEFNGSEYIQQYSGVERDNIEFINIENGLKEFSRKIIQPDSTVKYNVLFSNFLSFYVLTNYYNKKFQLRDTINNILIEGDAEYSYFSPKCNYLAVEFEHKIDLYSLENFEKTGTIDSFYYYNPICFDSGDSLMAVFGPEDDIRIFNMSDCSLKARLPLEEGSKREVVFFLKDSNYMLELLTEGKIRIWDIMTREIVYTLEHRYKGHAFCCEISRDYKYLGYIINDLGIYVLDLSSIPVGVTEDNSGLKIKLNLFPNPADELISINYEDNNIHEADFEIRDIHGNIVKSGYMSYNDTNIDISEITTGVYFLTLKNEKIILTKKFIVQ